MFLSYSSMLTVCIKLTALIEAMFEETIKKLIDVNIMFSVSDP